MARYFYRFSDVTIKLLETSGNSVVCKLKGLEMKEFYKRAYRYEKTFQPLESRMSPVHVNIIFMEKRV